MIWNQIYYQIYALCKNFLEKIPDVEFEIPSSVWSAINMLVQYGSYFIPVKELAPILLIEFSLINITLFTRVFKFIKDDLKI